MRKMIILVLVFLAVGCAQKGYIGKTSHHWGRDVKRIIWIQVAGLSQNHFSMLKMGVKEINDLLGVEKMPVSGRLWNFNLFTLRPSAQESFWTQLSGQSNIKGKCSDYLIDQNWKKGFEKIDIFENLPPYKNHPLSCKKNLLLGDNVRWWISGKKMKGYNESFHFQRTLPDGPGVYFDESCQNSNECQAKLYDNSREIIKKNLKRVGSQILIIRDFSFQKALKSKKILKARNILAQIDSLLSFVDSKIAGDSEALMLLTSAEVLEVEMPNDGREWEEYEKKGNNVLFHKSNVQSFIMAKGAGAERFSGIMMENEIHARLKWNPRKSERNINDIFSNLFR